MLQRWAKFSNGLVQVRMIRAKNYKTVTKFVKVMPRILWPLFSGHGVYRPIYRKAFDLSVFYNYFTLALLETFCLLRLWKI